MRLTAVEKCAGSFSIPMNFRPVRMQAIPVVPLPIKGSNTVAPFGVFGAAFFRVVTLFISVWVFALIEACTVR